MNFGQALEALKGGRKVTRSGWNGKGLWLILVNTDSFYSYPAPVFSVRTDIHEYDLRPFIAIKSIDETLVPWLASQTDMLAEDWGIVG